MAQTKVDVCNSALQKIGATRILSLADNSREARECNIAYDSNRRDELRKHAWVFAKKRAVLAPDSAAPAFDYAYQFTLPSDCLRVLLPQDSTLDWAVEGRKILTNANSKFTLLTTGTPQLNLTYLADVEDCAQWDPSFYNVMAISLAIDICEPLTNSNQKKQVLLADYKDAIDDSARMNAFEQLPKEPPDDSWLTGRI